MIHLQITPMPSTLLYLGEDKRLPAIQILQQAADLLGEGNLQKAESLIQEALYVACQRRHPLEQPLALLYLSDVYRETGRPGPALRMALQAYEAFQRQPSLPQRHNEGIAAYTVGLAHHTMGNFAEALNWYTTARQMLAIARDYWVASKKDRWARRCARTEAWIACMSDVLVASDRPTGRPTILIPVWPGDGDSPSVVEIEIEGYLPGNQLRVNGRVAQMIEPPGLKSSGPLILDQDSRVFPIPDSVCSQIGARTGDYVLAQRESRPSDAPYYVVETDAGTDFIRFHRQPDGSVAAESMTAGRSIGGSAPPDPPLYRPVAFLRPRVPGT